MLQKRNRIFFYRQPDAMDCGPTCLQIIAAYHGKQLPLPYLRKACYITNQGVNLSGLEHAARQLGFKSLMAEIKFTVLQEKAPLPCILHWQGNHFVVLYKIDAKYCYLADPAVGKIRYAHRDFMDRWEGPHPGAGYALLLEPTDLFTALAIPPGRKAAPGVLAVYLRKYPGKVGVVLLTLLAASGALLAIPVLTQAVVDRGVRAGSTDIVKLLALAQCALILGRMTADIVRARLLFFLGSQLSLSLLNGFLEKLMRLPMSFFESRNIGDNVQRLMDHQKVEEFVTRSLINLVLAVVTILVFGTVLLYYDGWLFLVFAAGSLLALGWALSWKERRKQLDYQIFRRASANQNMLIETISAIGEIKLTGYQQQKTRTWMERQEEIYGSKLESLKLDQRIMTGAQLFNELKNLLITCIAATLVIRNEMTLGMMLSASYIAGQLNAPVLQLAEFFRSAQNARFILSRMQEIQAEAEEDEGTDKHTSWAAGPQRIHIEGLSFHYGSPQSGYAVKDITLTLPAGKTTAIVGMSGSGKTTLIKLLLKFYTPQQGSIYIGKKPLRDIHAEQWRARCGAVMQDGHIFSDTIANNIATGLPVVEEQLVHAARMANIYAYISSLPHGFQTKVGKDGQGLSQGQQQRLLIARLIYRNPDFIFMDEATNALDANNEKAIIHNLADFFRGKTVLIVAHRLSTVKNADQLIVMDKGVIVESGTHHDLVGSRGAYFHLIKNQLELDK